MWSNALANIGYPCYEVYEMHSLRHTEEDGAMRKTIMVIWWLCMLGWAGFSASQVYASWLSYHHPVWSVDVHTQDNISFPGVMICPPRSFSAIYVMDHASCSITQPDANETCGSKYSMVSAPRGSASTAGKPVSLGANNYQCLTYNADNPGVAESPGASLMTMAFTASGTPIGSPALAVMLFDPTLANSTPSVYAPLFFVLPGSVYYGVLSLKQNWDTDSNLLNSTYSMTLSSEQVGPANRVTVILTYRDFYINDNDQYVLFDAWDCLGNIGAGGSVAALVVTLARVIVEKYFFPPDPDIANEITKISETEPTHSAQYHLFHDDKAQ
jgi:hypothetical protein